MNAVWRMIAATAAVAASCTSGLSQKAEQGDTFTAIVYPGANVTYANAINDAGDIVGQYMDSANLAHGFLLSGGKFTAIDFPGARQTWALGINSRGDISGYYGLDGVQHGFL